jgi:hypothetical protein
MCHATKLMIAQLGTAYAAVSFGMEGQRHSQRDPWRGWTVTSCYPSRSPRVLCWDRLFMKKPFKNATILFIHVLISRLNNAIIIAKDIPVTLLESECFLRLERISYRSLGCDRGKPYHLDISRWTLCRRHKSM